MGTTPAFGLRYPEITDKLTDGALAIRNLAEDVDADLAAEVTRANAAYVARTLADAAGDLLVADAPDSFVRLPKGAALQGLRVNAAGTALEYAAVAGGDVVKIAETTLAAAAASIEFGSIPQTYRALLLVASARGDAAVGVVGLAVRMNGDTGANYQHQVLTAAATAVSADSTTTGSSVSVAGIPAASATASQFGPVVVELVDYALGDRHKSVLGKSTLGTRLDFHHGYWRNVAAVTSITVLPSTGSLIAGSVVRLYGVK